MGQLRQGDAGLSGRAAVAPLGIWPTTALPPVFIAFLLGGCRVAFFTKGIVALITSGAFRARP